jgi:hypothetical protein
LRACDFAFEPDWDASALSVPGLEAFCACSTPLIAKESEPSASPESAILAGTHLLARSSKSLLQAVLSALRKVLRLIGRTPFEFESRVLEGKRTLIAAARRGA